MRVSVKVIGEAALKAKLTSMGRDAMGPLVDMAAAAGAEIIRAEAVRRAPVQDGILRKTIVIQKEA